MMSQLLGVTAAILLAGLTASLSGQDAKDQPDKKPITIVGCVVHGLPNSQDGSTATTSAVGDEYFVRTPTVTVPKGTTVAVGTPGSASTATSIGTPTDPSFYRIVGLAAERLRPHVGHRVELQGHLTDNMPGIESQRATTKQDKDGRATTTVETRIAIAGVLHATSIKMVSVDCEK